GQLLEHGQYFRLEHRPGADLLIGHLGAGFGDGNHARLRVGTGIAEYQVADLFPKDLMSNQAVAKRRLGYSRPLTAPEGQHAELWACEPPPRADRCNPPGNLCLA